MEHSQIEYGIVTIPKQKETICGDYSYILPEKNQFTAVLSDGLGSGVKANILATLTSKILSTLMAKKLPIEECVYTIASTLPMCKDRKLAYATFTGIQIESGIAYLVQYDNPKAILLRNGKCVKYPHSRTYIDGKDILESRIPLEEGDMFVFLTDGVTSAGLGKSNNAGWKQEEIMQFLEAWYEPGMSPRRLCALIADACLTLCLGENEDDMTAIAIKVQPRSAINLLIGPPENKIEDNKILRLFFAKEGKHVVCGGTTAKAVASYLHRPLIMDSGRAFDEIPATASIEGVDLVTEGVITLEHLVTFVREYAANHYESLRLRQPQDGVSKLALMLLEEATDINIFFGTAVNAAHEGLEIEYAAKLKAVHELNDLLVTIGKNVKLSMC